MLCIGLTAFLPFPFFNSAQAQYKVVHLGKPVNTPGSETAALQLGDTVMAFSSLPANTGNAGMFGLKRQITNLYQARLAKNGKLSRPKMDRWGFGNKKDHTGNLAIDPVSRDAYFTRGDMETLRCDIWWAKGKKRRGWEKPSKLLGPVNDKLYTATHPAIGRLDDGTAILYFVSDRPGGMGGMDIWQCAVKDGVASDPVNLGPQVNSSANEYTPFYDQTNGTLYFSSDREGGKGGFDIYCAVGQRNTWQKAEPVCGCLNSEQNDLYFTISTHDSTTGIPTSGYMSSNRKESYFLSDSMCCNDIFRWSIDTAWLIAMMEPPKVDSVPEVVPPSPLENLFPIYLYFHNDDPDPHSRDTSTLADYSDCQLRLALMRSTYVARQRSSHDSLLMELFFDSCVVAGFDKVNVLLDHISEVLADGHQVVLTVAGFASPLFQDDYNLRLSQRRIGSFINMIRAWNGGILAPAMESGSLIVHQEPQGAVPPTDESRASDAIYSLPAASARRIEVISCKIF